MVTVGAGGTPMVVVHVVVDVLEWGRWGSLGPGGGAGPALLRGHALQPVLAGQRAAVPLPQASLSPACSD